MFRVKIALLSVLLSGSVLVGLGLYSLSVMNRVNLDRIDREILSLGEGHLAVGPPRGYWQNFAESLQLIYREGGSENLVVQILDPGDEVLFRSPHWPAEISIRAFPDFERTMARPPDQTMDQRRPLPSRDNEVPELPRHPPPEAYRACEGKSVGSPARFIDPRGESISGICEEEDGRLVLRRTRPRGNGQEQAMEETRGRQGFPSQKATEPERPLPKMKRPSFATLQTTSGIWRTGIMGSERVTMMVGVNLASFYADAARYRRAFWGIVPIALLLLAAGGWVIARRALKPVALITRTAESMTARALDQRVPLIEGDREFLRLVEVINGMLDRLEKSFGQAVRFSADAAHELQTPLTILQGELDHAVQQAPVGSEEQQRYSSLLEEVQRLKTIVQKLLILARADAGRLNLHLEPTELSVMIEAAAEDVGVMAPHLRVDKQIAPGIVVKVDPELLGQAVRNLTSNAVKYSQENGTIGFRLTVSGDQARFTISNTGTPIPTEDREKIFERFYRVDPSRSKTLSGSGLGLSLAREIVRAHRGELHLGSPSEGLISFTMSLPLISP